jgi:hypothetical protein
VLIYTLKMWLANSWVPTRLTWAVCERFSLECCVLHIKHQVLLHVSCRHCACPDSPAFYTLHRCQWGAVLDVTYLEAQLDPKWEALMS